MSYDYTYTIEAADPDNRFLLLKYSASSREDQYKNFTTDDFTVAGVEQLAHDWGPEVRRVWDAQENPPPSEVTVGDTGTGTAIKTVYDPQPPYDPLTEKLEPVSSYDPTTATTTVSWNVVALTPEEADEAQLENEAGILNGQTTQAAVFQALSVIVDEVTLSDEDAVFVAAYYKDWADSTAYTVDMKRNYENVTYKCIQAHTSQPGWEPPNVPALWTVFVDPFGPPQPWVQPLGAHDAYRAGATVTYSGKTWISDFDYNVYAPDVAGWTEVTP